MAQDAHTDQLLTLAAPAKVNLALHVTGQREDGYHLLDSLVVFGGAADRLIIKPSDHLHFSVSGPFSKTLLDEPDNLIVRAAKSLASELNLPARADIRLIKNLPIAAGIGGGSSDAAKALLGLQQLWRRALSPERLHALALELGADVPMCLEGSCVRAQGIGDQLQPGPRLPADLGLVLINPNRPISTLQLFKALKRRDNPPIGALPSAFLSAAALSDWLGDQRNDMEMAAIEQAPVIDHVLQALGDCDRCLFARMSGSGATCFGLFARTDEAEEAARHLARSHPNWWVSAGGVT